MVRIKHRYLLVEILYPPDSTLLSSTGGTTSESLTSSSLQLNTHLHIHAPTRDSFTPGALAGMLRDEVAAMYGDWGVGKVFAAGGSGVSGMF
jgi:ribonuclease P/MRP protein subunit POP5